jgi:hypothetical protein
VLGGTHIKHLKRARVNGGTRAHANICFFLFFSLFNYPCSQHDRTFIFPGGETDAFVRVQIGDRVEALDGTVTDDMSVRTSCKVRNALNPVWNASDPCTNMTFGVQQAGTVSLTVSWWMGCVKTTTLLFDVDL